MEACGNGGSSSLGSALSPLCGPTCQINIMNHSLSYVSVITLAPLPMSLYSFGIPCFQSSLWYSFLSGKSFFRLASSLSTSHELSLS